MEVLKLENTPFFSVVVPTYKRPRLLKAAVESILNQTYNNYEVIIIDDDNSNNEVEKIVKSFKDDRIKLYKNKLNQGGGGARNTGIKYAKGKWIAFLDDDDCFLPNKLDLFYNSIRCLDDQIAILYSGYISYNFESRKEIKRYYPIKKGEIYYDLLYKNYLGGFSAVVIRRDVLIEVNGLDENLESRQDLDLYVRITKNYKVDYIDDCLVRYRVSNNDRISLNTLKRLRGNLKFNQNYISGKSDVSLKLKCRSGARIFAYAIVEKKWDITFKYISSFMMLMVLDFRYFLTMIKIIFTARKTIS